MQALQFSTYGGPEVLEVAEVPEPQAGPGQIRIAVRTTSVNPIDWKIRSGAVGTEGALPRQLGFDAAGVVDQVGEGVEKITVGDEVFGLGSDTAAEYAVLNSWAAKPPSMPWAEAAAAGVAGETAHRVLGLLGTTSGQTVLIDGAAGGVGLFGVQLAVARGATVIGTASERNHEFLASLGATPVSYGSGLGDRVRALYPDGVDGVFDAVGKTPVADLIGLVDRPEQVVSIANFAAAGSGIRVTSGGSDGDPTAALAEVAALYAAGRLQIPVQTFPLADAEQAHRLSEGGHVRGKLVLVVG
ncbi:NADP-dependent oxidoreductase [Microlunatus panaciterrae]|uniref:NADPH:quinone reductase-like Zn-dependent oxidoreductase n=1 Tax=Microlunatus panaciterrae TaxID=400768 RepID=A0ABS2RGY9_9ACTN|nr:NADP-dependent oxidoreductase [Microlunatus panaciterrae]MBM7797802.1 NADPH:quinone reductase-like Zn-dependent oxidoreductase [Microlunatus panaciterrae]